jgi:hypothetical protein
MARTTTTFSKSVNIDVPYHFKCVKCGMDSGTLLVNFTGFVEEAYNGNVYLDNAQGALYGVEMGKRAIANLIKKLNHFKNLSIIEKCADDRIKNECPHCKEKQAWGIASKKYERYRIWAIPFGLFCLGGFIGAVLINFIKDADAGLFFGPAMAGLILGIPLGISKQLKYKKRYKKSKVEMENISAEYLPQFIIPEIQQDDNNLGISDGGKLLFKQQES